MRGVKATIAAGIAASVAAMFFSAAAPAQEASEAQAVISRQLDAFAHDDAEAAYAQAAPEIRAKFSTPQAFLAMVKTAYPAVYRHRSVQFGAQARSGAAVSQGVTFVDADNDVWKGVYTLTRESDGAWKVTGCALIKSDETSL